MATSTKKGNMAQLAAELKSIKQAVASSARQSKSKKSKKSKATKQRSEGTASKGAMALRLMRQPRFSSHNGNCIVDHSDYIGDITGQTLFTLLTYGLNPGIAATFPWLSGVAHNWENYRWRMLNFHFKSLSGTAVGSTNTALGSVMLATQYDLSDPNFVNKTQLLNFEGACDGVPFRDISHNVLKGYLTPENSLFVRTGSVPSGYDPRLYDIGLFSLAVQGMQASNVIGELWVDYSIELIKPRLAPTLSVGTATHIRCTSCSNLNIFGNTQTVQPGSNLSLVLTSGTNSTISFPTLGNFYVTFYWIGSGASTTTPTMTGGSLLNVFTNGSTNAVSIFQGGTSTLSVLVSVTSLTNSLTVSNYGGSSSNLDIFVCQTPIALITKISVEEQIESLRREMEARLAILAEDQPESPGAIIIPRRR